MSNNVSISSTTLKEILRNILNPDINATNRNIIIDHLLCELSSDSVDMLVYLQYIKHAFQTFDIGDTVLVPSSYLDRSSYNIDMLVDLGIYHSDQFYYGIVTGDSSWRSQGQYNKASSKLKIDVYVHDDDGNIAKKSVDVLQTQLFKSNKPINTVINATD